MLTKAVQTTDNHLFLHGSNHGIQNTAVSSCLVWMDKGLHGCWETAQPAGCNQNLSASEQSSSTCYFLSPSITERLRFLHSQKLRCKSTDASPWIEATYFLLVTLQISSFLVVRTPLMPEKTVLICGCCCNDYCWMYNRQ